MAISEIKDYNFFSGKNLLRLELAVAILISIFCGFAFDSFELVEDAIGKGLLVSLLFSAILIGSYTIKFIGKHLKNFILGAYSFCLLLVAYIAYNNSFENPYLYALLILYLFITSAQERLYSYLIANGIFFLVFNTLILISRETNTTNLPIILGAFILVFLVGLSITFSRNTSRTKLNSRKNLLNYIFNNSSEGLILIDEETQQIVDVNKQAEDILRAQNREELIGFPYRTIQLSGETIIKEDYKENETYSLELIDKRILNYYFKSFEFNKKVYVLLHLKLFNNQIDFNLSEEFNMIISASEDNYRYLFEESSSLICVIDKSGLIKDVNSTLLKRLGYSKNELIGKQHNYLDARSYPERAALNEKAFIGQKQQFEKIILDKYGNEIDIEVILRRGRYFGEDVLISNSRDISSKKELERSVKYNAYRYKTLFELSPIAIIVNDKDRIIIDYNTAFLKLFELEVQDVVDKHVWDFSYPGEERANDTNVMLLDSKEKQQVELEKRYVTKSGKVLSTLLKVSRMEDGDGEHIGYIAQIIDITYIKETQKQIEISEKSYRDLFNNSFDLLYILDENNCFIDVNEAVVQKYGYSKLEIIGNTPDLLAAPDLNNMDSVMMKMGSAWEGKDQKLFWWSAKKDGTIFPKDLSLRKGVYKGKSVLYATGRDISESFEFERQLKEKEKRYRDLFERNLAGVYRTSRDGLLLECNQSFANILGFDTINEMKLKINANDFYVVPIERENLLNKIRENRNVKGEKVSLKKKNGEWVTVLLNVSQIRDENDIFQYFEGSLIDITDLDRAQNALIESQERYRKLIDNASFGILILKKGEIIFSNDKAANLLSYDNKADMLHLNAAQFFEISKNRKLKQDLYSLGELRELPFQEVEMINRNQQKIEAEIKIMKYSFDGKDSVFVSFLDISDRRKIEKERERVRSVETFNKILQAELKEKERAQKKLVDAQSYTEGIIESSIDMIFTTDIEGKINQLNSAAKKELLANENSLGKPLGVFFDEKDREKEIMNQLEKDKSFSGEVVLKRTNQSLFPAYISMSYLYNSDDVILGIMGVSRNILDIKEKEYEIKEQAAKLNAIIESSSHFFFTVNQKYEITSYNSGFRTDVVDNQGNQLEVGMHFYDILPQYLIEEDPNLKEFWNQNFIKAFQGESVNFEIERKNISGETYFRELYLNPIYSDSNEILEISGIGHDITEKKVSEINLKDSLKEKEVLLKEVHHRVKNNMQVISSILSLQSAYVHDDSILNILRESQNRIKSMAFIHERLYQTKDFSQINFSEYLKNLTQNLIETYEDKSTEVELQTKLESIFLNLDMAIPCGLIVNELVSNTLKYAFENEEKGLISISLGKDKNKIKLSYADNGKGFDESIDFRNTETLGLQLVNTLVEQLEGEINLIQEEGTKFIITFENKS